MLAAFVEEMRQWRRQQDGVLQSLVSEVRDIKSALRVMQQLQQAGPQARRVSTEAV